MNTPDLEELAGTLAVALRRGEDPGSVLADDDVEALREAAGFLREISRSPSPDTDPDLLLSDDELFVIDRQFRRADALAALYEADARRAEPELADLSESAAALAKAIWADRELLDGLIGEAATDWKVERMPPVDRTILRIALWELRNRADTPTAVVIAEAVRLAKVYSTGRSGGFVNGVLARLAKDRSPEDG